MRARPEAFGAIVALDAPPALVWVDRAMARALGVEESPRWDGPEPDTRTLEGARLSAPTEVHLMTTNRCPAGCPGCYTSAVPESDDATTEAMRAALRAIAERGVFHVALGGGESLLRRDLFALARYARELGLVPNLTTSGIGMNPALAEACRVFGQVNVSLDGLGETYRDARGYDGAERALRALELLAGAGVPCGINYVLSERTWGAVDETLARIAPIGVNEVEFLRFKPAGRGRDVYADYRLSEAHACALLPRLLALQRAYPGVHMKIDCSLVPFVCAADPDAEVLERFGIYGCEAGHALAAVTADLVTTPCSFVADPVGGAVEAMAGWETDARLEAWRTYPERAPEPCASCTYRRICKGGCKVVTRHLEGAWFAPDPECPRVRAHRRGEPFVPVALPCT